MEETALTYWADLLACKWHFTVFVTTFPSSRLVGVKSHHL